MGLPPTLQVEAANEEHAAVPEGDLRSHNATTSYQKSHVTITWRKTDVYLKPKWQKVCCRLACHSPPHSHRQQYCKPLIHKLEERSSWLTLHESWSRIPVCRCVLLCLRMPLPYGETVCLATCSVGKCLSKFAFDLIELPPGVPEPASLNETEVGNCFRSSSSTWRRPNMTNVLSLFEA